MPIRLPVNYTLHVHAREGNGVNTHKPFFADIGMKSEPCFAPYLPKLGQTVAKTNLAVACIGNR